MTSRRARRALWTVPLWAALFVATAPLRAHADGAGRLREGGERSRLGALCRDAALAAEKRHGLPSGLLIAIGQVETGRPNPATGRVESWPWSVQANGQSAYFASKADAMASVQEIRAKGTASVDAGCLQVNLAFHPDAFTTLADAFDPVRNADYAARFLASLHAATGDWWKATGLYHSKTVPLASAYRGRVERAFVASVVTARVSILQQIQNAWGATLAADPADPRDTQAHARIGGALQPAAWDPGPAALARGGTGRRM